MFKNYLQLLVKIADIKYSRHADTMTFMLFFIERYVVGVYADVYGTKVQSQQQDFQLSWQFNYDYTSYHLVMGCVQCNCQF